MFNIVCLVKFVPDLKDFQYDYERNVLVRENSRLIINPDDVCALAFALKCKELWRNVHVRVVSMGPKSIIKQIRDLLRRNIDEATLLTDFVFSGSDSYVTSNILAYYLTAIPCSILLTGTSALDGGTSHVPSQVAELLHLPQMVGVTGISFSESDERYIVFEVLHDDVCEKYSIRLPALLGISSESKAKLPFVSFQDLEKDVDDRITILSNHEMQIPIQKVGLNGSPTRVVKTHASKPNKKEQVVVHSDQRGVEFVYQYLREKGLL